MADIILVVVGLIIIVISFLISENDKDDEKEIPVPVITKELLESSIDDLNEVIIKKFDRKFEERWEETIADADDQMGQISNEKIMAVHDFSAEVLEKINQNHEDVIFLYKMLNDKEEELKQMALEIERSKNEWQSFYKKQKQREYEEGTGNARKKPEEVSKRREKIRIMDSLEGLSRRDRLKLLEAMDKGEVIPDMDNINPYEEAAISNEREYQQEYLSNEREFRDDSEDGSPADEFLESNGDFERESHAEEASYIEMSSREEISGYEETYGEGFSVDNPEEQIGMDEGYGMDDEEGERQLPDNPAERQAEKLRREREEKERKRRNKTGNMSAFTGSNWNQEVLRLHNEGKSVQEISKLLKKGQGEVKLVLDLFKKVEQTE